MKRMKKQFIKDVIKIKLMGLFFIAISIILIVKEKDGTFAVLFIPLGLLMLFSREKFDPKDYEHLLKDKES